MKVVFLYFVKREGRAGKSERPVRSGIVSLLLGGQVHIALGTVHFLPATGLIYISRSQLANRH